VTGYAGDITPEQAWSMVKAGALLVDVRTAAEWKWVGIPATDEDCSAPVFIEWVSVTGQPNDTFVEQLMEAGLTPGGDTPVVFLCRSGQRSIGAATAATTAGIGPAYNILHGFEGAPDADGHRGTVAGWKVSGLPWRQG
jgi:rhodanese-related sulfurtransferase